jgi:lipoic acid synthetase
MTQKFLRKPEWIKVRPPASSGYFELKKKVDKLKLHTVCQEANCPNISECWAHKTLTLMILGDQCTRNCKFCNVKTFKGDGIVDENEPENIAELLEPLKLRYVVLTSVDRDDIEDGGSAHFTKTVQAILKRSPETIVEVLCGDFQQNESALHTLAFSGARVLGHNVETVKSLTPKVRDRRASFESSLFALHTFKKQNPSILTKSSLMLGFGENIEEIEETFLALREANVDLLTIGQYLQPSRRHLPVEKYYTPKEFEILAKKAKKAGFLGVASGPLVRSSYEAGKLYFNS